MWLRQNILIFAKEQLTEGRTPFSGLAAAGPLSMVHPEMYMGRLESVQDSLQEYRKVVDLLSSGKTISAVQSPDGGLSIRVKEEGN